MISLMLREVRTLARLGSFVVVPLVGVVSIRDFMRDDVLAYLGFKAWQPPDYGQPEFMSL